MSRKDVWLIVLLVSAGMAAATLTIAEPTATKATVRPGTTIWVSVIEARRADDTLGLDPAVEPLDQVPVMVQEIVPWYPEGARKKGLEGEVWVKSLVGPDGGVMRSLIAKPSVHPIEIGFEHSAVEAAMEALYTPAMDNGKPVPAWITYPVVFALK